MSEDSKNNIPIPLSGVRHTRVSFFRYVFRLIKFIWPIFWSLLVLIMLLGIIIGIREGWTIGNSLYFAFITAFTIGYGDITPHYPLTKILAVVIGLVGFLFTINARQVTANDSVQNTYTEQLCYRSRVVKMDVVSALFIRCHPL